MTITGQKHTCSNCEARFFDFGKTPARCPKCDTEQVAPKPKDRTAIKNPVVAKAVKVKKPFVENEDEDSTLEEEVADLSADLDIDDDDDDDDDDDNLMEDTSDLGDDDDVAGVIEYVPESDRSDN